MKEIILSYMVGFMDADFLNPVKVECTKWDEDGQPLAWAVRWHDNCMSKRTGGFAYEPKPSDRTKAFYNEYRFPSAKKAMKMFENFYPDKILK